MVIKFTRNNAAATKEISSTFGRPYRVAGYVDQQGGEVLVPEELTSFLYSCRLRLHLIAPYD